jgi:membrane protease subunit HflC
MKLRILPLSVAAVALVALLLVQSLFVVREGELVLVRHMGQAVPRVFEPGLHWCWPMDAVIRIDGRVRFMRIAGEAYPAAGGKPLLVDVALVWRVRDAGRFQLAAPADEQQLQERLAKALRASLKPRFAALQLGQLLAAPAGGIDNGVLEELRRAAGEAGVEILDARVQRLDPGEELARSIHETMQAGYTTEAGRLRADGAAEAERMRAEAERSRDEAIAAGEREAQRIRGEGDAQAAAIYARAWGLNPEFAAYYRSLAAYRNALVRDGDVLVIEPDGDFYKYLRSPARH